VGLALEACSNTPKWAEGLSHRERRFVEEYLVDLNQVAALRRIGPKIGGEYASGHSANVAACHYMSKPQIAKAIERALNEESITRVWIIHELARIARADLSEFLTFDGNNVIVHDHDKLREQGVDLSVLAECSETITEFGKTIKVRLHDKKPALDKLAKLLGMEKDRVEHTGADGGPIEVRDYGAELLAKAESMKVKLNKDA
jgi:phage terminase small subunit